MPRPSPFDSFTEAQWKVFKDEVVRRNFKDYDGLTDWLTEQGLEVSRSSAYRHANKLKRRLQAVKDSTEAARLIAEAAPDNADLRSAAVVSMVQSELFDVMVTLQDADAAEPAERVGLLKEAARAVLDMTKASISQKQWQQQDEERIRKEERLAAAQAATQAAKAEGVSEQGLAKIRAALGMVA